MTLRHLKIFVAVADCNSFTLAAERLYLAQPAVSLAVRELEQHYGIRLFDRLSHRISITPDGRRLYTYARHILDTFSELERDLHNPDGLRLLRVGCSITIGTRLLPGLVTQYKKLHPDIEVEACICPSERVEQQLLSGALDVGLIEGRRTSDELVSRSFMRDRLAVVCAPSDTRQEISPAELFAAPLLLRERGSGTRELLEAAAVMHGACLKPVWQSTSTQALIAGVEAGHGLSVLPYLLVREQLCAGRLHELTVPGLELHRELLAVWHRGKLITPGLDDFLQLLSTPELSGQLG